MKKEIHVVFKKCSAPITEDRYIFAEKIFGWNLVRQNNTPQDPQAVRSVNIFDFVSRTDTERVWLWSNGAEVYDLVEAGLVYHFELYGLLDDRKATAKAGDWIWYNNELVKLDYNLHHDYLLVACSTDPSLGLPLLPDQFVQKFVKRWNQKTPIIKTAIEYSFTAERKWVGHVSRNYFPKTTPENNVIITSVKDVLTREEIAELILNARGDINNTQFPTKDKIIKIIDKYVD